MKRCWLMHFLSLLWSCTRTLAWWYPFYCRIALWHQSAVVPSSGLVNQRPSVFLQSGDVMRLKTVTMVVMRWNVSICLFNCNWKKFIMHSLLYIIDVQRLQIIGVLLVPRILTLCVGKTWTTQVEREHASLMSSSVAARSVWIQSLSVTTLPTVQMVQMKGAAARWPVLQLIAVQRAATAHPRDRWEAT